jgi:hypothetical protein
MIMECIIGQGTTWHKPLFDNSVVAPDDGAPKRVGYNTSAYRCYRGSRLISVPTKHEKTHYTESRLGKTPIPAEPGEKEAICKRYLQLVACMPSVQAVEQVAKETGRSRDTIDFWIRKAGIKRGRKYERRGGRP